MHKTFHISGDEPIEKKGSDMLVLKESLRNLSYPNAMDISNQSETCLLEAIRLKNYEHICKIMKRTQVLNKDVFIDTPPPLAYAIKYSSSNTHEIISLLLDYGANPNQVFYGNNTFQTILQYAIDIRCIYIVDLLVSRGANINFCIPNVIEPPLVYILKNYSLRHRNEMNYMANLFLVKGADISNVYKQFSLNVQCLHLAIDLHSTELVQLFLDHNAPINGDSEEIVPPLIYTLSKNVENIPILRILLEEGANLNAVYKSQDNEELTPIKVAVHRRKLNSLRILLENGADVNFKSDQTSPITISLMQLLKQNSMSNGEFIHLLLSYGAKLDQKEILHHFKIPLLTYYTSPSRTWHLNENIIMWLVWKDVRVALCTSAHNPIGILNETRKLSLKRKTIECIVQNAEEINLWDINKYLTISDHQHCPVLSDLLKIVPQLQCLCLQKIRLLLHKNQLNSELIEQLPQLLKKEVHVY